MARLQLAPQSALDTGLNATYTQATIDGVFIAPGDLLHVKNTSGATTVVTLQTGRTVSGKAVADTTVSIATANERFIGGLGADLYAQESGADVGRVYVDFSTYAAGVVAACIRQP